MSQPCETIQELYEQKQRWGIGGLDMKLRGYLMMALGFILNISLLASPFMSLSILSILSLWIPRVTLDAILIAIPLKKLKRLNLLKYFPLFEGYYIIYVVALPFIVLFGRKVVWKGREF